LTELSFTAWSPEHTRDFSYLIPKSSLVKVVIVRALLILGLRLVC
jgi:hypothetical protein